MTPDNDPSHQEPVTQSDAFRHLRRSPRFKAFEDRQMAVVVQRAVGFEPREMRGRILDLSAGGAKMAVPFEVALQETVAVRFDLPEINSDVSVAATVCWARTAGGNSWRLGCSFAEELPESLMAELAVHGYIDRREDNRQETGIAAAVQWEMTRETTAVQLNDLSQGGFSIFCPETAAPGTRLRLLVGAADGEGLSVAGVVRWQRSAQEGSILGCAYLEEGAYRRLEAALMASARATAPLGGVPEQRGDALPYPLADVQLPREPRRLTLASASRTARRQLVAAGVAIGGAFSLVALSPQLGPTGWAVSLAAMLAAAWATASYHRLTQQVLSEAAEAARNGKLC